MIYVVFNDDVLSHFFHQHIALGLPALLHYSLYLFAEMAKRKTLVKPADDNNQPDCSQVKCNVVFQTAPCAPDSKLVKSDAKRTGAESECCPLLSLCECDELVGEAGENSFSKATPRLRRSHTQSKWKKSPLPLSPAHFPVRPQGRPANKKATPHPVAVPRLLRTQSRACPAAAEAAIEARSSPAARVAPNAECSRSARDAICLSKGNSSPQ